MRSKQKRLLFTTLLTVVTTIIAIFTNFGTFFSGPSTVFTIIVTLLFFASWIALIFSAYCSMLALTLCACYWTFVITTIAVLHFFPNVPDTLMALSMMLLIVSAAPMSGISQIISQVYLLFGVPLAFLALIAIVAAWQWRSKRRKASK